MYRETVNGLGCLGCCLCSTGSIIGGTSFLLSGKAREDYKISARKICYFPESTENFGSIREDTVIILPFADEK